ncbi:MarR family winged helix-turn-helix transcriptional regulator [Enterococcus viikkiensis]|uniref:MarR family winged helix-turn-helix transcriptional regulator n=1 Tax=Enterococcus viikkiensis TaxID=930854 RepID=UPI0010F86E51|nr:MarR family transcriptional regulator [Enterococcus viikkiensis]
MENDFSLTLANQICFAVYDTNRLFIKFYQKALKPFNLTYPQYIVLLALWENDHQTLKQLSERLSLGSNTLTPLLKRLEQEAWIIREQPEADKRQLLVHLSDKSQKSKTDVQNAVLECVGKRMVTDLNEYNEALEVIQKMNKELKRLIEN